MRDGTLEPVVARSTHSCGHASRHTFNDATNGVQGTTRRVYELYHLRSRVCVEGGEGVAWQCAQRGHLFTQMALRLNRVVERVKWLILHGAHLSHMGGYAHAPRLKDL